MPRVSKEVQHNVLINPTQSKIIYFLNIEPDNSNGLFKRDIGKTQSVIYRQLVRLADDNEKYIISSDVKKNAYQVNYPKLIEEFIKHSGREILSYEFDMIKTLMSSDKFKTLKEIFIFVENYSYYQEEYQKIRDSSK